MLGRWISMHDDIRDILTPVCEDGVVISPKSCKAIMVSVPTMYEPSGQTIIPLSPGQVENYIPKKIHINDYSNFNHENSLIVHVNNRKIMLDIIKRADGEQYTLPDPISDIVLKLGRETASTGRLIVDLANLSSTEIKVKGNQLREKKRYLNVVKSVFIDRRFKVIDQISRAKKYCENNELSERDLKKIQFYILLSETYLTEVNFLMDEIKSNRSIKTISVMASIFRNIRKDQVSKLPKMINGILAFDKEIKIKPELRENEELIRDKLFELTRDPFNFYSKHELPNWFHKMVDLYSKEKPVKKRKLFSFLSTNNKLEKKI
jgi:hypothetical protein